MQRLSKLLATAALVLVAATHAYAQEKIRLAASTQSIGYTPVYAAEAMGYFKELGLTVERIKASSGPQALSALISGDFDIVTGNSANIPNIRKNGGDVISFAALLPQYGGDIVATKAWAAKMNITGKRYTTADLPKALQKVMESLVKLGYVKLKDITSVMMERMRNNENWKHLADQVTPFMVRQAYKKLTKFEGKETDADVDAVKGKELDDIIKKRQPQKKTESSKEEIGRAHV